MMKVKRILVSGVSLLMLSNVSFSAMSESVGELTGNAFVSQGKSGYRIDLQLPAGVNDLTPALSIRYQQGSQNGPLGLGV
ncbi:hypothetical protein [Vibrio sp. SCSIO 43137]|uniref:hypothetical protein n=1 Tax=Vibrio sp. SCSIO 43137 TaxID=3021011 RepID=UPI0023078D17|nr:hypothetical protein [Vibrio sp. SCSIO 43137]WCE28352.1 hypothetical protein PK654_08135 [Vibrio sp. SCSIO 43137]